MKSARITILVSEEEKADIGARAAKMKIPTGELLRRAVASYEPEDDSEELETLASEFERIVKQTESKLDRAIEKLASVKDKISEIRDS
jgi:hypothetical protein